MTCLRAHLHITGMPIWPVVLVALASSLFLSSVTPAAWAQSSDTITIEATADPNPVGDAESVTFTLRVEGAALADIETPDPPLTEGLALQQSTPTTQRDISFSNGRLTRAVTFQWRYKPVDTGTARFHPVKITVQGKAHETETIDVSVIAQAQRSQPSPGSSRGSPPQQSPPRSTPQRSALIAEDDVFIRAELEAHRAYQNEQITVTYHLYFREGIRLRHSRLADAWDAPGFWREELDVDSRPIPRSVTVEGQPYQTIVLKRAALFPTRVGSLQVDPLEIETEARVMRRRRRFDPFSSQTYESVALASDSLMIESVPLPDGAPDHFDGAVGDFRLRASVRPTEVQAGQPVRLRVRVEGTGNIATLQPPAIEPPDAFEAYDPKENTSIDRDGERIRGTKTFTYVLVPQSSGTYTLPPTEFTFFDPEQRRYRTLRATPAELRVVDGEATAEGNTTVDPFPEEEVAGVMAEAQTWVRAERRPLYLSPWPYVAILTPLLLAGGVATLRRRSARPARDDAFSEGVAARLQQARRHIENQQPEACYGAIERAILGFIGNKLDVAASGLTRARLDTHLARRDVPVRAREALYELLDVCDQARYSPARSSEQAMQSALRRAEQLINFLGPKLD